MTRLASLHHVHFDASMCHEHGSAVHRRCVTCALVEEAATREIQSHLDNFCQRQVSAEQKPEEAKGHEKDLSQGSKGPIRDGGGRERGREKEREKKKGEMIHKLNYKAPANSSQQQVPLRPLR